MCDELWGSAVCLTMLLATVHNDVTARSRFIILRLRVGGRNGRLNQPFLAHKYLSFSFWEHFSGS